MALINLLIFKSVSFSNYHFVEHRVHECGPLHFFSYTNVSQHLYEIRWVLKISWLKQCMVLFEEETNNN